MAAIDNFSEEGCKERCQRLADSRLILLSEYESLLRNFEPTRILNRIVLIAIVLLEAVRGPLPFSQQAPYLAIAALASCFWLLQELLTRRRLGRLGALIASRSAELSTEMRAEPPRPVVLPPLRKPTGSVAQVPSSTERVETSVQPTSGQAWINAYNDWRYEARKDRGLQRFQRSEPIFWFALALGLDIYRLAAGH